MKTSGLLLEPATVISKKRGDAPEVHYLIGPQRESREEAETDLARWKKSIPIEGLGKSETSFERWWNSLPALGEHKETAQWAWNEASGVTRESAAAMIEAAGCICYDISVRSPNQGFQSGFDEAGNHDPRCPVALAVKIREGA